MIVRKSTLEAGVKQISHHEEVSKEQIFLLHETIKFIPAPNQRTIQQLPDAPKSGSGIR